MPAPKSNEFEREMQLLEAEMKRLEAEYNMFFAGRLPKLPWESRARVEAAVKRWDRTHIQNTAERFRFSTLQARFAKFCELWERTLSVREGGRPMPGRRSGAEPPPAAVPGKREPAPAVREEGVVHVARFRDPAAEQERLQELHAQLTEARRQIGEQPVAFDRLEQLVKAQVQKLGGGGGADVAFRVAVKDGKVTLTAKALKDGE